MNPTSTWLQRVALTLLSVIVAAGCSSQTRHRVLCVFFTGVDRTNSPPVRAAVPVVASTNTATFPATPASPAVYFHEPYFEHKCVACHVSAQSQELHAIGADLCFECHKTLIGKARYVHAPVDDGKCHLCHDPHKSTEPHLLTRKGQDVCLDCHKVAKLVKVKAHATMDTVACVNCHDPHRSDQKKLVKATP